jgi:ABC-2 type transport system ATP-binding protein
MRRLAGSKGEVAMADTMIEADGLVKSYGNTRALAGVSFSVPAGSVLGLLGPNGAGKTTAVRILTTLALPDAGRARVAGIDVLAQPAAVRRQIGVAAQDATLDGLLTGRQNLALVGELSGLRSARARARSAELLELFELTDAADRVVKGYSGGMRRRLDLAASLLTRPPVLFLDEPTTGLDPVSRQRVWEVIRELIGSGVTLLLTTQYLDEADALAELIVVVNHGEVIASGTPRELKERSRSAHVEVRLARPGPGAAEVITPLVSGQVSVSADGLQLGAAVDSVPGLATALVRALDGAGLLVDNIEVRQPSLDDVFFALTGAHIPGANNGQDAQAPGAGPTVPGSGAEQRESAGVQA